MKVLIKRLTETAKIPSIKVIEKDNSPKMAEIGIDLYADEISFDENGSMVVSSGIAIEPPKGYYFCLYPRSSVWKTGFGLANSVGIIDPSYRGNIKAIFYPVLGTHELIEVGDRFCQLVLKKNYTNELEIEEVESLSSTSRGEGGFGSTGR